MIRADQLASTFRTTADHRPGYRRYAKGIDEPGFHQVEEAEADRSIDLGDLAEPYRLRVRAAFSCAIGVSAQPATKAPLRNAGQARGLRYRIEADADQAEIAGFRGVH